MTDVDLVATRLLAARQHDRLEAAPSLDDPGDAYRVQDQVASALGWFSGCTPRYWKSGGPSRTDTIFHAPLPPAGVWNSPAQAAKWPFTIRGIEAEVALRLREPVDAARAASTDLAGARKMIDAMCVSIEIVDSRWTEGLGASAGLKLADLMCHGALVLGAWRDFDAQRDWSQQTGRVRIRQQPAFAFAGSHSMADPGFVLPAWLRHATRHGEVLAAGSVVTTGTWCGLLHAQAGDEVEVVFDGIGMARVQL